jgi:hypothetical protein
MSSPDDDSKEKNRKDTKRMLFSPERFYMQNYHLEKNIDNLTSSEGILSFVNKCVSGEMPLHYKSENDKWSHKFSSKLVGEEFEKRVIETKRDALVLISHPLKEKNRGLQEKFEHFAKISKAEGMDKQLFVARYNGVNESEVFKNPAKLPALVLFKTPRDRLEGDDSTMKE